MDEFFLKLKNTEISLPPSQKPKSKDFPKAKIRTSTPKCISLPLENKTPSRPPSPRILTHQNHRERIIRREKMQSISMAMSTHSHSTSIKANSKPNRKSGSVDIWKSAFVFNSSFNDYKNPKCRVKNPTRVLNIPLSSIK